MPKCLECDGTGEADSGGVLPWGGEWINVPCPYCDGSGEFAVSQFNDEQMRQMLLDTESLVYDLTGILRERGDDVICHVKALLSEVDGLSQANGKLVAEINRRRGEMAVARQTLDEGGVPRTKDGVTLTMSQRIRMLYE